MAISIDMQNITCARARHYDTIVAINDFSTVTITSDGGAVTLYFHDADHIQRANAVAAAINGEAK